MMNKTPSKNRELGKFLFVLPLMAGLLLACTKEEISESALVLPPPPPPTVAPPPPPPVPAEPEPPKREKNGEEGKQLEKKMKVDKSDVPPSKQALSEAERVIPFFTRSFYKTGTGC